jgi:hypothetical protein
MKLAHSPSYPLWRSLVVVAAAALGTPTLARAEDAHDPAAAEVLFRQGREASEQQDFSVACAKFRESNRLDPAVGTVFNIAACEEKLGHLATAWTLFREVVQRLPSDDNRHAIAEQRAAALEGRLPKLTVHRTAEPGVDVEVRRDGVLLGNASLDTALPIDPGEHRISVTATGRAPREFTTQIAEGQSSRLDVAPGPALTAPRSGPAGAPLAVVDESRGHGLGYVLGGVGLAGLVTGAVAGVLVLNRKATVADECNGKECSPRGMEAVHSGKTLGLISGIGFAVGVAGLGSATYVFLSQGGAQNTPTSDSNAYALGLRGTW